jgi:transcription initiation factor TFIIB
MINYENNVYNRSDILDIDVDNISGEDISKYFENITNIYNDTSEHNEVIIEKKNKDPNKKNKVRTEDINIIKEYYCDNCKNDNVIEDASGGIIVCRDCGDVKSKIINFGSDHNNYNDGKKEKSRTSHPISALLPQSSTATVIAGSCSNRIKMLHTWNNVPYKERTLNETFKKIQEMCHIIGVPKCIEDDAKIKFKMISDCVHETGKNCGKSVIVRGDKRKSLIVKCLLEACNSKNIYLPPKKIAKSFGVKHTKGGKVYQQLTGKKNIKSKINFPRPDSFITMFCNEMNLMKLYKDQCLQISTNVLKIKIASVHNSLSIAAGSIYLMAIINNLNIQKKQIAVYFCVSEVTISKTFHKIQPFTKILLNDELCAVVEQEIIKYQKDIEIHDPLEFTRFNVKSNKRIDMKKIMSIVKSDKIDTEKLMKQNVMLMSSLYQQTSTYLKYDIKITNNIYQDHMKNIRKKGF